MKICIHWFSIKHTQNFSVHLKILMFVQKCRTESKDLKGLKFSKDKN